MGEGVREREETGKTPDHKRKVADGSKNEKQSEKRKIPKSARMRR